MPKFKQEQANKGKHFSPPDRGQEKSPQQQTPVFCLEFLGGAHCLSHCNTEEKAAFSDRLHTLSKMTWQQISLAPRHGLGSEIISKGSLKSPLPNHITEDVNILAFRFYGKAPMLGYRTGRIFHILMLDRSFTAYSHG